MQNEEFSLIQFLTSSEVLTPIMMVLSGAGTYGITRFFDRKRYKIENE